MLDDLKFIHEKDPQDALGIAEKQWEQLGHVFDVNLGAVDCDNIVFAGMGGSALAALLSTTWPGYTIPFEIVKDYKIPQYVSERTFFIASSYSGNTEETLEALEHAEQKGAQIVVIACGGKLAEKAQEKGYPFALLPQYAQPRFAALASLKALVTILEKAGLLAAEDAERTLHQTSEFLKGITGHWRADVPTNQNLAKQIALECMGKSPVIYSGPLMFPAAYKWKISFNENAKNVAWCNQIPEFSHNEMMGWTSHPTEKPYTVIELRSNLEHPRVLKRFEVTERMLSGQRPAPIVVEPEGDDKLEQLLFAVALGDFVSLYTALLNGINPTPVPLIEKFKKALDE